MERSFLLLHKDSDACQDALKHMPDKYDDHFDLLFAEDEPHPSLHPTVALALHTRKSQPKSSAPTVMFFDPHSKAYVKHEGIKSLMFLHNYRQDRHFMDLTHHHQTVKTHADSAMHKIHAANKIQETVKVNLPDPQDIKQEILEATRIHMRRWAHKLHNDGMKRNGK